MAKELQRSEWIKTQDELRKKVVVIQQRQEKKTSDDSIRYVGGLDISFKKDAGDNGDACAALVVIDLHDKNLCIVYQVLETVRMIVPYVPGFLAFREVPVYLKLLEKVKTEKPEVFPHALMVDGNGILHPREFGCACHVGVLANIPTIGVSKNLHLISGISKSKNIETFEIGNRKLMGFSSIKVEEKVLGNALWVCVTKEGMNNGEMENYVNVRKPIYVSVGHLMSLESATLLVAKCSVYRVPEPIRQADLRSRESLRSQ